MNAIIFYRLGHWFYVKRIPLLPKLIWGMVFLIFNSHIPCSAKIGKGSRFAYGGIGCIIHSRACIGERCLIGSNVTIGGKSKKYNVPVIDNDVYLATGCKILGDITIGNNVIVGANAVVVHDVPNNCIVAGIPARVIKKNINLADYY